jgi:hypothetical protein
MSLGGGLGTADFLHPNTLFLPSKKQILSSKLGCDKCHIPTMTFIIGRGASLGKIRAIWLLHVTFPRTCNLAKQYLASPIFHVGGAVLDGRLPGEDAGCWMSVGLCYMGPVCAGCELGLGAIWRPATALWAASLRAKRIRNVINEGYFNV